MMHEGTMRCFARTRLWQALSLVAALLLWPFAACAMPMPVGFFLADVLALLGLAWLARRARTASVRTAVHLHVAVSYAILPLLYSQGCATTGALARADFGPLLADLDRWLLGGVDPILHFDHISTPVLTEIMQWSYNVLWVVPLGLLLPLLRAGNFTVAARATLALTMSSCLVFFALLVVPATGPGYHAVTAQHGAADGPGPAIAPVLYVVQSDLRGVFAAGGLRALMATADFNPMSSFPSGHVTTTLICAALAFRLSRRFGWCFLPLAGAGVISTVYLRYHYVVDVAGGVLAALPALPLTREPAQGGAHE